MLTGFRWIVVPVMALVSVMATAVATHASPTTREFTFSASPFACVAVCPAVAPTDPVAGSATLTFDPMGPDVVDQPFSAFSLTIDGFAFPLASVGFDYLSALDTLLFGELTFGVAITSVAPDWVIVIQDASTAAPSVFQFLYAAGSSQFISTQGIVSSTVVPEPGTLAVFAFGLAGLGFTRRRWQKFNT